jgi:hypothetical protein
MGGEVQPMSETATLFTQNKYLLLRSLLNPQQTSVLYRHALDLVCAGRMRSDPLVPDTPALYAEPRMERLLLALQTQIEATTGLGLYPTYSYLRVYKHGDVLARHRDRASCEITLSLTLGYAADAPWPLWIEAPDGIASIQMQSGDALLYRGTECPHWREAFSGEHAAQVFLNYVDRNGPNVEWKFDKRPSLRLEPEFAARI